MHDMKNYKFVTKLTLIINLHKHRLIIPFNIIIQINCIIFCYLKRKIEGKVFGPEERFWFCNLAILHMVLAKEEVSWHLLNLTN